MRARLLGIVLFLVALLVFGLGIPLALSVGGTEQQRLFLDRLTDTTRFASVAQRPLTDDQPEVLRTELGRYTEVYGIGIAVVDRDGTVVVSAQNPSRVDMSDPSVAAHASEALAGRRSTPGPLLLPWDQRPLVLAEPILVDGEVRGAVVTVSPTDRTRERIRNWWLVIAGGGVLAFCLALMLALPIVRWIMRPVRRLDDATSTLVSAIVSGRPAEPVSDDRGPPELRHLSRSFDRMASQRRRRARRAADVRRRRLAPAPQPADGAQAAAGEPGGPRRRGGRGAQGGRVGRGDQAQPDPRRAVVDGPCRGRG